MTDKTERVLAELETMTREELREIRRWLSRDLAQRQASAVPAWRRQEREQENARRAAARVERERRNKRIEALRITGMTMREIAREVGISPSAVHRHISAWRPRAIERGLLRASVMEKTR